MKKLLIIGLPSGYELGFTCAMGPSGVWIGILLGLTSAAIMMLFRFHLLTRDDFFL